MVQRVSHVLKLYDSPDPGDLVGSSPATPGNYLADLILVGGTVILDRTWSPYCQAELVVALPSPGVLDQLDPRIVSRRLYLTTTQTNGAGVTTTSRFDLQLRGRVVDWIEGTVTLSAASDEGRLHDRLVAYSQALDLLSVIDVRSYLESWIFNDYPDFPWGGSTPKRPYTGLAGTATAVPQPQGTDPVVQLMPGVSYWDTLDPLLQATGLRLWCDELRQWHLDKASAVKTSEVDLSYLDSLTQASDAINRSAGLWADQVIVTYNWTDTAGNPHTRYDGAGPTFPTVGVSITHDASRPVGGAAARVLQQLKTRGRELTLRARADWRVRPDWIFTALVSALLPVQRGYVSRIELDVGTDQMTLTTREVIGGSQNAWVVQPAGTSWASVPAGVAWSTYDAGQDRWQVQPAGRTWGSIPGDTAWSDYLT